MLPETGWTLCTILSPRAIAVITLTNRLLTTETHSILNFVEHRICFLWLHYIKKTFFSTS